MPAAILPAVLLLLLVLCSVSTATNVSLCSTSEWNVTFHDGFDGDLLNPLSWTALNNYTHGHTEKELYLSKNTRVSNGTLILTTKKERAVSLSGVKYNFTSGWVESKKKKVKRTECLKSEQNFHHHLLDKLTSGLLHGQLIGSCQTTTASAGLRVVRLILWKDIDQQLSKEAILC